jgi:hypothetical protein
MTGHGAKLPHKQEAAIVALLTHRTIEEAARAIDVSTKTLLRWLKLPEFDAAYRAARKAAFKQSMARLHHMLSAAVSTFGIVMMDTKAPAAARVSAADKVVAHVAKAIELEDLDARVREIEEAAGKMKVRRP